MFLTKGSMIVAQRAMNFSSRSVKPTRILQEVDPISSTCRAVFSGCSGTEYAVSAPPGERRSDYFTLASFFENLRGVGTGEKIDGPVEEHPGPVEIVAQLVEVDPFPDKGAQETTELHAQ